MNYRDNKTGAVEILKGGDFAEGVPSKNFDPFIDSVKTTIISAAISYMWVQKEVYIVRVTFPINGKAPCDLKLAQDDFERICEGDMAYFIVKNTDKYKLTKGWSSVPGFDKLKDYAELNIWGVVKSSEWSQRKGGFLKDWSVDDMKDLYESDKTEGPPGMLLFNLPLCDLDALDWNDWESSEGNGADVSTDDVSSFFLSCCLTRYLVISLP